MTTIAMHAHRTPAARPLAPVRTHSRGGAALAVGALLLLVAVAVMPTLADLPPRPTEGTTLVRVSPSDTLWSLAREHAVPGATTAQTAQTIRDLNGLGTGHLVAGRTVRVPSTPPAGTTVAMRSTAAP